MKLLENFGTENFVLLLHADQQFIYVMLTVSKRKLVPVMMLEPPAKQLLLRRVGEVQINVSEADNDSVTIFLVHTVFSSTITSPKRLRSA